MASIKNLIAIDGSERIVWNPELGQLECCEGDLKQNLLLTKRPYFAVRDVRLSPARNLLALIGEKGVTIVELPRRWGRRYKNDLRENQTYCNTFNINERLFTCDKRLRTLHVAWHPLGIEAEQVLCLLTNDNRLRFHDVTADIETQVINLKIRHESQDPDDSDGLCLGLSMMNLGEYAICFDFGPPLVVQEPDVLWPIYILMGSGDVYLIYTNFQNPTYADHIIGPLTMLPQAEDNYGADACSLIVLDSSPPMLAIATPTGYIYHCFAFHEPNEVLPRQTLYVYESIELSKDLIQNPDDLYSPHPMRLFKDPTSGIRYFCVHHNGVHAVVLPILETLQTESEVIDDKESFSEFIICTRTTTPSDALESEDDLSTPRGLGVEVRQTSIVLLVLLPNNEMLVHRVSPATTLINRKRFPRHSLNTSCESNDPEILNLSQVDASRTNFQEQIQQILKRKTSIPMLKLSENLEEKSQMHKLVNRAITTFESEYLRKFELAAEAIKKKLTILENDMENQKAEYTKIVREKEEVYISVISLASRTESVRQKQQGYMRRIDKILAAVSHGPEMGEAETKLRRELNALNEKVRQQRDHLDSIINKHTYQHSQHSKLRDPALKKYDLVLTQTQLDGIKETLSKQGAEIAEMKRAVKAKELTKQ